jgi:hypothetical protein
MTQPQQQTTEQTQVQMRMMIINAVMSGEASFPTFSGHWDTRPGLIQFDLE